MRLLRTDLIELVELVGKPPYAILSHTWDKEEVTHNDLRRLRQGIGQSRHGYMEIQSACAKAVEDGFQFIVRLLCIETRCLLHNF
jgi:hypothetical protein